jgi:hypothetical protein
MWFRFFDDVRAWLFKNKKRPEQNEVCKTLVELYASECYHKSMILIPEQQEATDIAFLEAKLTIKGNKEFACQMYSKNYESILNTGKLKFWTGQDGNSWGNDVARQRSTLIGRLTMLDRLSTSNTERLKGFAHILVHYICLGYKMKAFKQAIKILWYKTQNEFFKLIQPQIPFFFSVLEHLPCLKEFPKRNDVLEAIEEGV